MFTVRMATCHPFGFISRYTAQEVIMFILVFGLVVISQPLARNKRCSIEWSKSELLYIDKTQVKAVASYEEITAKCK
jgi:hypothetical protein